MTLLICGLLLMILLICASDMHITLNSPSAGESPDGDAELGRKIKNEAAKLGVVHNHLAVNSDANWHDSESDKGASKCENA
jgi:hypothetical protein